MQVIANITKELKFCMSQDILLKTPDYNPHIRGEKLIGLNL